jgi:hypothetical protein
MLPMKTGINNLYRGFKGLRTRFYSEILRFLNDFFDFRPFFSSKNRKLTKNAHFLDPCAKSPQAILPRPIPLFRGFYPLQIYNNLINRKIL